MVKINQQIISTIQFVARISDDAIKYPREIEFSRIQKT